jgi:hypothetical protein
MRAAALALVVAAAACAPPSPSPKPAAEPPPPPANASALHLGGELPATMASVGAPGSVVAAGYDVCLDGAGRVARVRPAPGLAAVDEAIAAALRRWSWFVVASAAPPCWRQTVLIGVPAESRIVRQAGADVRAHALTHPTATPPRALAALYAGKIVDGRYKVCVGDDGRVQSVRPVPGIAGGDDWGSAVLRATAWEVLVGTLAVAPYCFGATAHLDLSATAPARTGPPPLPPPATPPKEPGVSIVVTR